MVCGTDAISKYNHCYNVIGDYWLDLTSGQFGGGILVNEGNPEQFREVHFAKEEVLY